MKTSSLHTVLLICVIGVLAWYALDSSGQPPAPGVVTGNPQGTGGNETYAQKNVTCSLADATSCVGENSTSVPASGVSKVEVIHFHGTHQCYSCITVGNYAEETISTYFSQELKEGKITFAHLNLELPENQGLVVKYGVTSASLWIGVYDNNGFHKEQNTNVWYKINDKTDYMNYLKGILEKRLNGDLS